MTSQSKNCILIFLRDLLLKNDFIFSTEDYIAGKNGGQLVSSGQSPADDRCNDLESAIDMIRRETSKLGKNKL